MTKEKRIMLITGTSRGIGLGIAQYFLKKGYAIEGCSRDNTTFKNPNYRHSQVDVGEEPQVTAWIRDIERKHGRVDVVVNNAGLSPATIPVLMTRGDVLENVFRTNVIGTYLVSREVASVMVKRKFGRIINISSMAVGLHEEGTAVYAASKNAISEFTRIMAKEWASLGITCNVVAPSMIRTRAVDILGDEVISRALNKLTIKRVVTMEEICHVLEFLIDPLGGIITGQIIYMGLISG